MDKFRLGQRVVLVKPIRARDRGQVGTIIGGKRFRDFCYPYTGTTLGYEVDFDGELFPSIAEEDQLAPLDDGGDKGSWEDCAWKPDLVYVER